MRLSVLYSLFAPSDTAGGPGLMVFLFQMVAIMAIFYFLIIRPKVQQEKKHKERLGQLKRGDEVVTAGGIVGEVVHLKDDRVTVRTGEARVVIQRDRIAEVRPPKTGEGAHPA
ncbi:MAG TPA: preprotein translocase subunit YajC [Gemmatimonadales bacterium]